MIDDYAKMIRPFQNSSQADGGDLCKIIDATVVVCKFECVSRVVQIDVYHMNDPMIHRRQASFVPVPTCLPICPVGRCSISVTALEGRCIGTSLVARATLSYLPSQQASFPASQSVSWQILKRK